MLSVDKLLFSHSQEEHQYDDRRCARRLLKTTRRSILFIHSVAMLTYSVRVEEHVECRSD
jgi:hypothetical protein